MSYLEELLPEFRKGAKIMRTSEAKILGKQPYYFFKDNKIWYDNSISVKDYNNRPFTNYELMASDWELVKDPKPDWDYIIKNKCLCWFWYLEEEKKVAGLLADYDSWESQFGRYKGKNVAVTYFYHCRPVRRDEVTFYEDRDDKI